MGTGLPAPVYDGCIEAPATAASRTSSFAAHSGHAALAVPAPAAETELLRLPSYSSAKTCCVRSREAVACRTPEALSGMTVLSRWSREKRWPHEKNHTVASSVCLLRAVPSVDDDDGGYPPAPLGQALDAVPYCPPRRVVDKDDGAISAGAASRTIEQEEDASSAPPPVRCSSRSVSGDVVADLTPLVSLLVLPSLTILRRGT